VGLRRVVHNEDPDIEQSFEEIGDKYSLVTRINLDGEGGHNAHERRKQAPNRNASFKDGSGFYLADIPMALWNTDVNCLLFQKTNEVEYLQYFLLSHPQYLVTDRSNLNSELVY